MNQKEILRYLGASCREPRLEGMIGQAWEKVVRAASPLPHCFYPGARGRCPN